MTPCSQLVLSGKKHHRDGESQVKLEREMGVVAGEEGDENVRNVRRRVDETRPSFAKNIDAMDVEPNV